MRKRNEPDASVGFAPAAEVIRESMTTISGDRKSDPIIAPSMEA
jgi:hypothetical protein